MKPAPANERVLTTLVTGASAQLREDAIARLLQAECLQGKSVAPGELDTATSRATPPLLTAECAILLEGLPAPQAVLPTDPAIQSARIAPGCVCCSGNLVMQVTLNRLLRVRPQRLLIALASTAHLAAIQDFLSQPPYDTLLRLTPLLQAEAG